MSSLFSSIDLDIAISLDLYILSSKSYLSNSSILELVLVGIFNYKSFLGSAFFLNFRDLLRVYNIILPSPTKHKYIPKYLNLSYSYLIKVDNLVYIGRGLLSSKIAYTSSSRIISLPFY